MTDPGGPGGFAQPSNDFVVQGGDIVVQDVTETVRIRLDSQTGGIFIHNSDGALVFQWEMPNNNLRFGGFDNDGDLAIFAQTATNIRDINQATFHLDSQRGAAWVGGNKIAGSLVCRDADDNQTVFLDGAAGDIFAGSNGQDGTLFVRNKDNDSVIRLRGESAGVGIGGGGEGNPGELFIRNGDDQPVIRLRGESAGVGIGGGGEGNAGHLIIRDNEDQNVISLDGQGIDKVTVDGRIRSQSGGFVFPDGSVQNTATLKGDKGDDGDDGDDGAQGPPGPPGPAVTTFAVCVNGAQDGNRFCNCSGGTVVSQVNSNCQVTSDNGGCEAFSVPQSTSSSFLNHGQCCVCRP